MLDAGDLLLVLSAFAAGFGRTPWVIPEVTATLVAAFSSGLRRKFMIPRKAALIVWNACAALAGNLTLLVGIHGCKTAL
jgi:hypothetical protein